MGSPLGSARDRAPLEITSSFLCCSLVPEPLSQQGRKQALPMELLPRVKGQEVKGWSEMSSMDPSPDRYGPA